MARRWAVASAVGLAVPVALLLLWELAAQQRWISTLFYPAPTTVLDHLWELTRSGDILDDSRVTLRRLVIGFAIGAAAGVALGLAAGVLPRLAQATFPLASALYVIPRIALLPLALVAFGINDQARIFIVAFSVFFICFFSALGAARQVDPIYLELARAYGASRLQVLRSVVWPGALPGVFTGLQVALGYGVIIIIGTEFLAADDGLGARIWLSYQVFDFPSMYAAIVAVTIVGVALTFLIVAAERLAIPWRR